MQAPGTNVRIRGDDPSFVRGRRCDLVLFSLACVIGFAKRVQEPDGGGDLQNLDRDVRQPELGE